MSGRTTLRNRTKSQESKSMTLDEAQKKTGKTTKNEITAELSAEYSSIRYHGKTKTFYLN